MPTPIRLGAVLDAYPPLESILPDGGVPGLAYVLVPTANLVRRQMEGWEQTQGVPPFTLRHGDKTVDVQLLCKGQVIRGGSRTNGRREFGRDEDLDTILDYKES